MTEKRWLLVAPQAFTTNGGSFGQIQVASTKGLHVKQYVVITATGLDPLQLEIKRVVDATTFWVGPKGNIGDRTDLSLYTVALSASVYAPEQPRVNIDPKEIVRATYEEEPSVAWRVLPVDELGNPIDSANPLPVAFDGTISIGEVEVIGTNGNIIEPNPDGSLNVVTTSGGISNPTIVNFVTTLAATEYNVALPSNTKRYSIRARGISKVQLAFVMGDTFTTFVTVKSGTTHGEDGIARNTPLILYFQSANALENIEILYWT